VGECRENRFGPPSAGRIDLGPTRSVEPQHRRVDAIAEARGPRAVVEDVPKMPAAPRARGLRAGHEQRAIRPGGDSRRGSRGDEARPAGARVELRVRPEELGVTARAAVRARPVLVPELPGEGSLGPLPAEDPVLLGRERGAPFGIRPGGSRRWIDRFECALRVCHGGRLHQDRYDTMTTTRRRQLSSPDGSRSPNQTFGHPGRARRWGLSGRGGRRKRSGRVAAAASRRPWATGGGSGSSAR